MTDPPLLFVVHSAKLAGAQLVAAGQAEALARRRPLVVSIGHGPLRERFARTGTIVRGPTRLPIWGAGAGRWALELARAIPDAVRLAVIARRHGAGAIVVNSTILVSPVLAGRLARIPVVVYAHEAPKTRAVRLLFRFHGAFADTVVAISPWIAEAFGSPRARVVTCPVGIPIEPRTPRAPRGAADPLRLIMVGTIDRHKRQDLAVSALAALRDAGVDAELELVGAEADEAYAREVRGQVERRGLGDAVRFAGLRDDVDRRLEASDVLLVPTGEVTPLVIMEAMSRETPVVAAAMGSIGDVVLDGTTGLLVTPSDAGALADAVARLARDPQLASRLAVAGRTRVETHFDEALGHRQLEAELARLTG